MTIYPYSAMRLASSDQARYHRLNRLLARCQTRLPIGLAFVRPDGKGGLYIEPVYTVDSVTDLERLIDLFGNPFWDDRPTTTLRRVRPITKRTLAARETRPAGTPYPERFDYWTAFALRLKQDLIEQWLDRPNAMLVMLF